MDNILEALKLLQKEQFSLEKKVKDEAFYNSASRDRAKIDAEILEQEIESLADTFNYMICESCKEIVEPLHSDDDRCERCEDEFRRRKASDNYDYLTRSK